MLRKSTVYLSALTLLACNNRPLIRLRKKLA